METNLNDFIKYLDVRLAEIDNSNTFSIPSKEKVEEIEKKTKVLRDNIETIYHESLNELNSLVGLDEVKQEVTKLINYLMFLKKMQNKVKLKKINLNMIFRGNPGTGKTTVARIIAKMLFSLGFLESSTVIETTPRDFIAGYVGQTAIKAKRTIDSAKGGVIFIDEAYTFAKSFDENGSSFVHDCITEIIKEMESFNTVFIFAGYSKEIDEFIDLNPGIKSRVGYDIKFENHTIEQLMQIFNNRVKKAGLILSDNAKCILMNKIEENMKSKNFGNGRMIDNLFDQVIREHATYNVNETDEKKLLLITEDSVKNVKTKVEGGMCFG